MVEGRRFKLTLLMFVRYALMYVAENLVFIVLAELSSFDVLLVAQYAYVLNGIGDALLYNVLNPRYRAAS